MTYKELLSEIANNKIISKDIYICNFLNCKIKRMTQVKITLVKNILGHFVVTLWLDYEYNKYVKRRVFKNRDAAANYAWELAKDNKLL